MEVKDPSVIPRGRDCELYQCLGVVNIECERLNIMTKSLLDTKVIVCRQKASDLERFDDNAQWISSLFAWLALPNLINSICNYLMQITQFFGTRVFISGQELIVDSQHKQNSVGSMDP